MAVNRLKNRIQAMEAVVGSRRETFDGERVLRILVYVRETFPDFTKLSLDCLALGGDFDDSDDPELKEMRTRIDDMLAEAEKAVDSGASLSAKLRIQQITWD